MVNKINITPNKQQAVGIVSVSVLPASQMGEFAAFLCLIL